MRNNTGRLVSPCPLYQVPLWGPLVCVLFAWFGQLVALLFHHFQPFHRAAATAIHVPFIVAFFIAFLVVASPVVVAPALSARGVMPSLGVPALTGFHQRQHRGGKRGGSAATVAAAAARRRWQLAVLVAAGSGGGSLAAAAVAERRWRRQRGSSGSWRRRWRLTAAAAA